MSKVTIVLAVDPKPNIHAHCKDQHGPCDQNTTGDGDKGRMILWCNWICGRGPVRRHTEWQRRDLRTATSGATKDGDNVGYQKGSRVGTPTALQQELVEVYEHPHRLGYLFGAMAVKRKTPCHAVMGRAYQEMQLIFLSPHSAFFEVSTCTVSHRGVPA